MFSVDVSNLRPERQKFNILKLAKELYHNSPSYKKLAKISNIKQVKNWLNIHDYEYDDLLTACSQSLDYSKNVAFGIAKRACRQGKLDEQLIINGIADEMEQHGFNIRICGTNELRPCNDGRILSHDEVKRERLNIDTQCQKTIDGIFDGLRSGYIFAKVVIGKGGHQTNVLKEINGYVDWALQHGVPDKIYVMLIDGKVLNCVKQKQTDNVWVVNHIEFQEKLLGK